MDTNVMKQTYCIIYDHIIHFLVMNILKSLLYLSVFTVFYMFPRLVTIVLAFSAWPRTLLRMMLHAHIEVDNTIARSAIASASNYWES
jgi:hypothetical protein